MKLKFILDKDYCITEAYYTIKKRFTQSPDALRSIALDFELIEKIAKGDEATAFKILEKNYKPLSYMKKTLTLYQNSWDEINDQFFETATKITGHKWKHKSYQCILSPFNRGISTWDRNNKIIRSWQENPYLMRKITAHELLIDLVFTIFEKDFQKEDLTEKQKWALAEICAFAISGLENQMLKLWPWILEREKYPLNHTYPELYNLQVKLKEKYLGKKSFKDFLNNAIQLIKEQR